MLNVIHSHICSSQAREYTQAVPDVLDLTLAHLGKPGMDVHPSQLAHLLNVIRQARVYTQACGRDSLKKQCSVVSSMFFWGKANHEAALALCLY